MGAVLSLTGLVLTSVLRGTARLPRPDLAAEPKLTAAASRQIKSENTPSRASTLAVGTMLLRRTVMGDFRPLIIRISLSFLPGGRAFTPFILPPKRASSALRSEVWATRTGAGTLLKLETCRVAR